MPRSKLSKDHKERKAKRYRRKLHERFIIQKEANIEMQKKIEEHQKELEKSKEVQELLNKSEEE